MSMFAAVRTTTVNYDGQLVRVIAGQSRVDASCSMVRDHPDLFEPLKADKKARSEITRVTGPAKLKTTTAPGRTIAHRTATTTDARPTTPAPNQPMWYLAPGGSPQSPTPRLNRNNTASSRVILSDTARATILREAQPANEDGLETGGVLLGLKPWSWQDIRVLDAAGPGPAADRTPTSLGFDPVFMLDAERTFAQQVEGGVHVGAWHVHPSGGSLPSPADMDFMSRLAAHLDVQRYLMVIVTPETTYRWGRPNLTAWVLTRRGDGWTPVVERAEIIR